MAGEWFLRKGKGAGRGSKGRLNRVSNVWKVMDIYFVDCGDGSTGTRVYIT